MSRDRMYLEHILDCIERIEAYTHDGRDAFLASTMIQDAVIRNFEIIGEATKRLTPTVSLSHPEIQWRRMAGFRDMLIHQYMGVDLKTVWNVVERDLPTIKAALIDMVAAL